MLLYAALILSQQKRTKCLGTVSCLRCNMALVALVCIAHHDELAGACVCITFELPGSNTQPDEPTIANLQRLFPATLGRVISKKT